MKILLSVSDRDFLASYHRFFELSGYEVDTVFDGTQTISITSEKKFDIVILEKNIPRVSYIDIVDHLYCNSVPVILLTESKVNTSMLISEPLANAFLDFPFLPDELLSLCEDIISKTSSDETFSVGDVDVSSEMFKICGQVSVTNEEINILRSLKNNLELTVRRPGAYINALNYKFSKLQKKSRIRYVIGEGYKLVMSNE